MASSASARPSLALAALGLLAASLGACHGRRVETTGALYPTDLRTRHPFVLADGTRNLDVFPTGIGHLDPRQTADVAAFLTEFRRYGRGVLILDLPHGASPAAAAATERTGAAIRRLATESGLPSGAFSVARYPVFDPSLAAPLRLSFQRMEAKVASQCGLWPQDLGVSDAPFNLRNEPSWNLGCATRSNIAAQVADPVDLVRAREEGRIDTVRRTKVINTLRDGNDPSTKWGQDGQASVKAQVTN